MAAALVSHGALAHLSPDNVDDIVEVGKHVAYTATTTLVALVTIAIVIALFVAYIWIRPRWCRMHAACRAINDPVYVCEFERPAVLLLESAALQGAPENGAPVNGAPENGAPVNGAPENAVQWDEGNGFGRDDLPKNLKDLEEIFDRENPNPTKYDVEAKAAIKKKRRIKIWQEAIVQARKRAST